MRRWNGLAVLAIATTTACAAAKAPRVAKSAHSADAPDMRPPPDARSEPRATNDTPSIAPCIAVHEDAAPGPREIVEGRLDEGGVRGARDAPFVLRLTHPRCVVGLAGRTFLVEVQVAASFDLRPLLGARVRLRGEVVGGTSDFGGPAVVFVADDVERVPTRAAPEPIDPPALAPSSPPGP